jgi:oligopeptide transport system substrate-binding protein
MRSSIDFSIVSCFLRTMYSIQNLREVGAGPLLRPARVFASVMAACLLAVGCGPRIPHGDAAADAGILLLGNGAEPKGLDPHRVTGVTENKIISALTEGLIAYHPSDDNIPEPGVAQSWEANADASEWTFHLRPDARWSNGDAVTAHDFVYSYQRMLSPDLAAEYAQMLFVMHNAEAYYRGEVTDFSQVGVAADGDHTLRIRLIGPTPFFLSMLTHYSWFPVHPPTIERHGGPVDLGGQWTLAGNHVGNGAYQLTEWRPNQYIKVEANPYYWDRDRLQINTIYFFPIEDDNTEQRMFNSGRLHLTSTVPTNDIPALKRANSPHLRIDPYLGTYFYRFNVTRPPLDNPKVREALTLAIDRQAIVDKVALGDQQPATAFVPPGFSHYESPVKIGYDPERARQLLAEAGYPDGRGFPQLYLLFNTSEGHRKIAEAVVAMWNSTLNIRMQLENKEWKVYLDAQSHLDYDISRSGWIGDYMDPITFLEMFTTGNGNNDTGWTNPEYDRLIELGFRSTSAADHLAALQAAEAILLTELPIAPLYFYTRIYQISPRLRGWNPKLLDNRSYKYLYFAPN